MNYTRGGSMGKVVLAVLVVCQLAFALELMELASIVKRIASVDMQTAMLNNEAASHRLESEKQRRIYYETLVNIGIFDRSFIDESEAREIVRQGVK